MTNRTFANHAVKLADPSAINFGIWCEWNASGALEPAISVQPTFGAFAKKLSCFVKTDPQLGGET